MDRLFGKFRVEDWEIIQTKGREIRFPIVKVGSYITGGIPANHGAMYARIVAKALFGRYFLPKPAWDFRYFYRAQEVDSFEDLRVAHHEGLLKGGCLVGFHDKNSNLNGVQFDIDGNLVTYTQVGVFLGEDLEKQLRFGHQFGVERMAASERRLYMRDLTPKEIIFPIRT